MIGFLASALIAGVATFLISYFIALAEHDERTKWFRVNGRNSLELLIIGVSLSSIVVGAFLTIILLNWGSDLSGASIGTTENVVLGALFGVLIGKWLEAAQNSSTFRTPERTKSHFVFAYIIIAILAVGAFSNEIKTVIRLSSVAHIQTPFFTLNISNNSEKAKSHTESGFPDKSEVSDYKKNEWLFDYFDITKMHKSDQKYRAILGEENNVAERSAEVLTPIFGKCLQDYYIERRLVGGMQEILSSVVFRSQNYIRSYVRKRNATNISDIDVTIFVSQLKSNLIYSALILTRKADFFIFKSENCENLNKLLEIFKDIKASDDEQFDVLARQICFNKGLTGACSVYHNAYALEEVENGYLSVLTAIALELSGEREAAIGELALWLEHYSTEDNFFLQLRPRYILQRLLSHQGDKTQYFNQIEHIIERLWKRLERSEVSCTSFSEILPGNMRILCSKKEHPRGDIRNYLNNILIIYMQLLNNYVYGATIWSDYSRDYLERIDKYTKILSEFNSETIFDDPSERDLFDIYRHDTVGVVAYYQARTHAQLDKADIGKNKVRSLLEQAAASISKSLSLINKLPTEDAPPKAGVTQTPKLTTRLADTKRRSLTQLVSEHLAIVHQALGALPPAL